MKKRYVGICILVVACMLFMLTACQPSGSNSPQSDPSTPTVSSITDWDTIPDTDFEYRYDSELKGVVITKYLGKATKVRFPDVINGDPVVGLEYLGNTALVAVHIPNSVVRIGSDAFKNCAGLASITLPDSLTSIDIGAFKDCTGLTSITLPESLTSIGDDAFIGCNFTSLTLPDSVKSIGDDAFASCKKLANIKLPDTVKLGTEVFGATYWHNKQPDGIIYLGNVLYGYKGKLPENTVVIRDGVTSIAKEAFKECTDLTNVILPDSVTDIGDSAFLVCTGLKSINIPDGVTRLGYSVFVGCTGLTSITIPDSVTNIYDGAFRGCTGLTSITIPDSVTSLGSGDTRTGGAFENCTGLTSITLSNSIKRLGIYAFKGCTGLTSVTIPNSVTSIDASAFLGCSKLDEATKSRILQINPDMRF